VNLANYTTTLDARGRTPRFLVLTDAVINQHTLESVRYQGDWFPAYEQLHRKYVKDGL
jgi:hypothetical protein